MFDKEVYVRRRKNLMEKLSSGIILIPGNMDSPMNYPANTYHYRQDSNFLYFFGIDEPSLVGLIDIDNNKEILFGNDAGIDDIIWMGPQEKISEKAASSGISNTMPLAELAKYLSEAQGKNRKIHFAPFYRSALKIWIGDILGINASEINQHTSEELIHGIVGLRSYKEEIEIAELEKACAIGYEMHTTAMRMAKPGVKEQEIAGTIEGIPLKYGGHYSFPIILSQNGETLHNHDHSQILQEGRMLLTDCGGETAMHYASDHTRTIPVSGKFSPQQKDIYEIVLKAHKNVIENSKPGVPYRDMHLLSAQIIAEGLKAQGIFKGAIEDIVTSGAHAIVYPHGLGHMIGLDVHDMEGLGENYVGYDDKIKRSTQFGTAYLRMGRKLEKGFVVSNEPGIYFIPQLIQLWKSDNKFSDLIDYNRLESFLGFGGIRLEDDILITETGCKVLGKHIPITIEEVENMMQKG